MKSISEINDPPQTHMETQALETVSPILANTSISEWGDKKGAGARYKVDVRTIGHWMAEGMPHVRPSYKLVRFHFTETDRWLKEKFSVRRR